MTSSTIHMVKCYSQTHSVVDYVMLWVQKFNVATYTASYT